jgi:site-specific DNA-methyltransferase (adenine-specific)
VVIVDSDPDTLVAVRRKDVDLDTKEGREMAMLDNLTTQVNLAWDKAELESISDQVEGFDVGDFGFEIDDLPQVSFGEDNEKPVSNVDEKPAEDDDFDPDAKFETKVQAGDIWLLGEHKLLCGDSTDPANVLRLLGEEKADCWLTDPPYNVAYEGKTKEKLTIKNDSKDDASFRAFLVDAFTAAAAGMKEGAAFYIWHADSEGFNFRYAVREAELMTKQCLIWNKNSMVMGRQDFQWKHEPCLYGWKPGAAHNWYSDRKQTTVLNFDRPTRSEDHPTMKPVPLFGYQIQCSTKEGDIVMDTFSGSGTTIVACEQLHRKARCMELDPHYCNVIIARWEKLTGQKAIKLNQ